MAESRRRHKGQDNAPEPSPRDDLADVMDTLEDARPHHREHGKEDPRPDDDELERRTELERREVGLPEEPDEPDPERTRTPSSPSS
jgi:hypothetical protein